MDRLREQRDASDPVIAEAAKLLGGVAPAQDEPGQKDRVRRSLRARLETPRSRRAPAWVLVPAGTLLFGLAAFAAERIWNEPSPPPEAPAMTRKQPEPQIEPTPPEREDETLLLVEAMRTLRREHRPAEASALLDEYLRRHPDGALREEGLALAIEAATASNNTVRAAELAREYVQRHPNGPFRAQADAALAVH